MTGFPSAASWIRCRLKALRRCEQCPGVGHASGGESASNEGQPGQLAAHGPDAGGNRAKGLRFAGGLFLCALSLCAETTIIDCGSSSDSNFTGGLTFSVPVSGDQTGRYDALQTGFSYRVSVVDTLPYLVTLRFIEPSVQAAGLRIFSVSINNQPVIVNLDLYADVGFQVPTSRSFVAVGSAGALVISFTTQKRSAVISSIEVKPLAGDSTPVILPTSTSVLRGCAAAKIDATTIQLSDCAFGVRLIFGPE